MHAPLRPTGGTLQTGGLRTNTLHHIKMVHYITAHEANEILQKWAGETLPVCFAVGRGNLAWHAHWVGNIRNAREGRWVLTVDHTTNVVCTHEFDEITLTEDEDLLGMRFRHPKGVADSDLEVNLFIAKAGGLDSESIPLMQKLIQ